jgi:hypothetical protein
MIESIWPLFLSGIAVGLFVGMAFALAQQARIRRRVSAEAWAAAMRYYRAKHAEKGT